jgi:hypothetical protein
MGEGVRLAQISLAAGPFEISIEEVAVHIGVAEQSWRFPRTAAGSRMQGTAGG